MKLLRLSNSVIALLLFSIILSSCDKNATETNLTINESEVLVKYLESSDAEFLNNAPFLIKASDVMTNMLSGKDQFIIDIRGEEDYLAGHIKGAVNVQINNIVNFYESNNLDVRELVVITCHSGQGAGFATALLRLLGYSNVKDLVWGMCSWNKSTSSYWTSSINNARASQFKTTNNPKPSLQELPKLNTNKSTGQKILRARIEEILSSSDPLGDLKVSSDEIFSNLDNYYIINYWPLDDYNWGHIEGAVQYAPKESLFLNADLKTLPTNKIIAVYCYTGHTSAQITTYLRVLGYDAKTIIYGVNGMAYDTMPGTRFIPNEDIHDYELEK